MKLNQIPTTTGIVTVIPQDDWYHRSFNVLVPLDIQGKKCQVLSLGQPANHFRGTTSTHIVVNGKTYGVPSWAVTFIS